MKISSHFVVYLTVRFDLCFQLQGSENLPASVNVRMSPKSATDHLSNPLANTHANSLVSEITGV